MKVYKKITEQWRFTKCANDDLYCEYYNDFAQLQLPKPSVGNYTVTFFDSNDAPITGIGSHQNIGITSVTVSLYDFVNANNPCFYAVFTNGTSIYYTDMYCWTGQARCRKIWSICDNTKPLVFDLITATGAKTDYIANISNDIKVINYLGIQRLETNCDVISVNQKDVSMAQPFPLLCSSTLIATQNISESAECKGNYIEIESNICKETTGYSANIRYFTYKFILGDYVFTGVQPYGEIAADISEYFTVGDTIINLVTWQTTTVTASVSGVINFASTLPFDNSGNIAAGVFVNITKEQKIINDYASTCLDISCLKMPYSNSSITIDRFWSLVYDDIAVGDGIWDFKSWIPIFPSYVIGDVFTVIDTQTNITYTLTCTAISVGGSNAFAFDSPDFPSPPIPYYSYFKILKNGIPVTFTYTYQNPNFNVYNSEQNIFSNKKILCASLVEKEPNIEVKYNSYTCKAYKSSITKQYVLKVNNLMPSYAVSEIANILMRGEVYVDGVKYMYKGGKFTSLINKIKANKVEIPLEGCECEQSYYC